MNESLLKFLNSIHIPSDTIEKLKGEGDVDIDNLSKAYLDSRNTYYESTLLKTKTDEAEGKTVKGMTLKAIKHFNKVLGMGLTNTQMEEFKDLDAFVPVASKHIETTQEGLKNSSNEDLVKQVNEYKTLASTRQQELDAEKAAKEAEIARIKKEAEGSVSVFKAKHFWNKMVSEDNEIADIPGKAFALEAIEERIFANYTVTEDGKIFNKDGTIPTHPERQTNISTLAEIYPYFKEKAGLLKVSNGGEGSGFANVSGQVIPTGKPGPAELEMIKQFQNAPKQ